MLRYESGTGSPYKQSPPIAPPIVFLSSRKKNSVLSRCLISISCVCVCVCVCVCARMCLLEVAKRQLSIKWFISILKWFVLLVDEVFV